MRTRSDRPPGAWTARLLRPLVDLLGEAIRDTTECDPFGRDPGFVAVMLPLLRVLKAYFATEVRGWENVPERGPFLLVGNHSGGAETNDFWLFLTEWVERRGAAEPLYALAYDLLFAFPVVRDRLRRLGVIPASPESARRALDRGAAVLVFPGGDYEVFRPWSERNRIDFARRTGFVAIALEKRVPVVPVTIHGAHQSTLVLTRGRWIAHLLGIDRLHVNVFPLLLNLPFGLMPAFVPSVQLPAKVTIAIGKPLDWSRHGPRAHADRAVLSRCYRQITRRMQADLDALAASHPRPVLSRIGEAVAHPWSLAPPPPLPLLRALGALAGIPGLASGYRAPCGPPRRRERARP